jgi:hypothetical protein
MIKAILIFFGGLHDYKLQAFMRKYFYFACFYWLFPGRP